MIDHLSGTLVRKEPGHIVIDASGVGFKIQVPEHSYHGAKVGEECTIPTLLLFRQDGFALYGFSNATEREFFGMLTSISGIGPKSALGILASASPAQLAEAILQEDISTLVKVKGIGKKGAKRIIVELHEKIRALKPGAVGAPSRSGEDLFASQAMDEAREVLLSLGCSETEAEDAIEAAKHVLEEDSDDAADRLVMEALKMMGGPK